MMLLLRNNTTFHFKASKLKLVLKLAVLFLIVLLVGLIFIFNPIPRYPKSKILHRIIRSFSFQPHSDSFPGSNQVSGYLIGNRIENLVFNHYEPAHVDLRIIILAYNRPESLKTCLESVNRVEYGKDTVSLHVWIDRLGEVKNDKEKSQEVVDRETAGIANGFNFTGGSYTVHYQPSHAGVQGQWMNVWRPSLYNTKEIALILEDDMTVAPNFWAWLKAVHQKYDSRDDVSGYTISYPDMEHKTGGPLEIPIKHPLFLYRVICTWGFSPHPVSWRNFQNWYYTVAQTNRTFQPLVADLLTTEWFLSEKVHGRERTLWEQWHIYYTNLRNQYTIISNPPLRVGFLAINRHERGLHDGREGVVGATSSLCEENCSHSVWKTFPDNPPRIDFDGKAENIELV